MLTQANITLSHCDGRLYLSRRELSPQSAVLRIRVGMRCDERNLYEELAEQMRST